MHAFNALYLHFCPSSDAKTEANCTFSLSKQTCDVNHAHSLMSMHWSALAIGKHPLRAKEGLPARNDHLNGESSVF